MPNSASGAASTHNGLSVGSGLFTPSNLLVGFQISRHEFAVHGELVVVQ
jgi:hypothetical protein